MRAAALLAAATACFALPPIPPLQPNPLAGVVAAQRTFANITPVSPTNLTKSSYLDTIAGVVDWFLPFQNPSGAIIDPASHQEEEYSTPCFAHAAATLVLYAGRSDLLAPASLALTWAVHGLATANCASASCDFYAVPVMRAVAYLSPLVANATAALWESELRSITPSTWEFTGQNWELTAAAGEYVRMVAWGWSSPPPYNWTLWESRLGRLATIGGGGFWTPDGIFNDNWNAPKVSPMAYDAFATSYVAVLLAEGYNATGVYASYLGPIMERGVWTHAAYQSPIGEQPVGGRSNQHQFAEATLCAVAELYAARAAAAGDAAGACALKRAARLYHGSVRRWRREDGALQITKNWFLNYTERFGYMSYSYFSNYNLLPVSWLALAYEYADEALPECAAPADVGGVAFAVAENTMRKVYASLSGTYVEIMTGADPQFDASGFNRFHFDSCSLGTARPCSLPSLLGPSQAPGLSGNAAVHASDDHRGGSGGFSSSSGIAMGPFWTFVGDATVHTLANNTLQTILAAVVTAAPTNSPSTGVAFTVEYVLWNAGLLVTEAYTLPASGGAVNVTASLSLPGAAALASRMVRAAAAHDGVTVFYSPPVDRALASHLAAGDVEAFLTSAPPINAPRGAFATMGIQFPVLVFDGTTNSTVATPGVWAPDTVLVQHPTNTSAAVGALAFYVAPVSGRQLTWSSFDPLVTVPSRNGLLTPVAASVPVSSDAPTMSYSLRVVPWQAVPPFSPA